MITALAFLCGTASAKTASVQEKFEHCSTFGVLMPLEDNLIDATNSAELTMLVGFGKKVDFAEEDDGLLGVFLNCQGMLKARDRFAVEEFRLIAKASSKDFVKFLRLQKDVAFVGVRTFFDNKKDVHSKACIIDGYQYLLFTDFNAEFSETNYSDFLIFRKKS